MPQPLPVTPDGTPIPWEKVSESLAKGQARFYANEDVHVMNPATKEWRVSKGAKVGDYLRAGWTLASPAAVQAKADEEAKQAERSKRLTIAEAAKAELEGYGRGLSGGLTDVVGAAISPEWAENARARKEVHTLPSVAGELYGVGSQVVGAGLLTGGAGAAGGAAGAAARIGQLGRVLTTPGRALMAAGRAGEAAVEAAGITGSSLAGRAALAAARGATEGALLGAEQGISDAALENRPLASQKLLASIGHGFLLGGITGGLLQPAGEAVSVGGRRALESMMGGKSLNEALESAANRFEQKALVGNNIKFTNELTYNGKNLDRAERALTKARELGLPTDIKKAVPVLEAQAEAAGATMRELATARVALEESTVALRAAPTGAAWSDAAEGAAAVVTGGMDSTAARTALELARDQIARIESVPLGSHKSIADALRREIAPLESLAAAGEQVTFKDMWTVRQEMYRAINWARESKAPQYREMRELAGNFDDALTMDMDAMGQAPGGINFGEAWRKAKEDFHDFATLRDAAREEMKRQGKNASISLRDAILGGAFGIGGGPVTGLAAAYGSKLLRERGPAAMAKLLTQLAKTDTKMTKAAAELLESAPKLARAGIVTEGVRAMHKDPVTEFKARRDHLLASTSDPERSLETMGQAMTMLQGHPDMQQDVADLFGRANAYLLRHLPKPMARQAIGLTAAQQAAKVPRSEMMEWLERARTADDPVGEIAEDIAKGRVSQVKIQTMREVYPDLFAEWGQRLESQIAERAAAGHPLPYRRRVVLSMTFGFVGDESLEPERLAQTQQTHAALQQQLAAQQPPGPRNGGGQAPQAAAMAPPPMKYH